MKRNSWHWRLASYYGPIVDYNTYEDYELDICNYVKAILVGFKNFLIILVVSAIISAVIGDVIGWSMASISLHQWIAPDEVVSVALAVIIVVGLLFAYLLIRDSYYDAICYIQDKTGLIPSEKHPGVFALWYKGFKEKTCFKVTIDKKEF